MAAPVGDKNEATTLASSAPAVPSDIVENIKTIFKETFPEVVVILQLPEKYKTKFGVTLNAQTFGFESIVDLVNSIKHNIQVTYHDMLRLWVGKYDDTVALGEEIDAVASANEIGAAVDSHDDGLVTITSQDSLDLGGSSSAVLDSQAESMILMSTETPIPDFKPPPRSPSVLSYASSSAISVSSVRRNRLPPPPPSVNWASGIKSVLGKRQGTVLGGDGKRMEMDDTMSINSVDDRVPHQELRSLDVDRRNVKYIPYDGDLEMLNYDHLLLGNKITVQQPSTHVDTTFCTRAVLEDLMKIKYDIRAATGEKYKSVQDRMTEFGNGPIFHHNEAYLLANLDALTGWAITRPTNKHGELLVEPNDILYVVDIHGGPGGFAEYILTKRQWESKVFGFTLKDENFEYRLPDSGHYPKESFETWSGWDGARGDGSIYRPDFVNQFCHVHLRRVTKGQGVHVCIGGGKEVAFGLDEDRKEIRAKAMLLAECLIALKCLMEGGTFVLRLYDLFTPYTVGLVYLMYRAFEQVAIIRPETARPGSSERFLVCKLFRGSKATQEISHYLSGCHAMDWGFHLNHRNPDDEQADLLEVVPVGVLKSAEKFYDYIYESNNMIGKKQLQETDKICKALLYRYEDRVVSEQISGIRRKCSTQWNCPKNLRQLPKYTGLAVDIFASKILRPYPENILRRIEREGEALLTYPVMERDLKIPKEWNFVCVGRDRGFYLSLGGNRVYRFSAGEWKLISSANMELADSTLVYGDMVDEIINYDGKQVSRPTFHIIDGLVLGGKNIRNLPYNKRMEMCTKFARSMDKTARNDFIHIQVKKVMEASGLEYALTAVHNEQISGQGRNGSRRKRKPLAPVDMSDEKTAVFAHTGYLLLKTVKDNNIPLDFLSTMQNRLYWRLDDSIDRNPRGPIIPQPTDSRELQTTCVCSPALVHHIHNCSN